MRPPFGHNTERVTEWLAIAAGWSLIGLSFLIVFESAARSFLGFSIQSVDEIGGYVLAVTACVGFSYALITRSHIRIDMLHRRLPRSLQVTLNLVAFSALGVYAGMLAWRASEVFLESAQLAARAPTPLRTPLVLPQGVWAGLMICFVALCVAAVCRMIGLIARGHVGEAAERFGIATVDEELAQELKDIEKRAIAAGSAGHNHG